MSDEKNIERIDHLIDQGKILRPGPRSLPRSADTFVPGIVYVDDLAGFSVWRAQSLAYLLSILEPEHPYLAEFRKITEGYLTNLELGIRLLEAAQIDLKNGRIEKPNAASINAAELVETNLLAISPDCSATRAKA